MTVVATQTAGTALDAVIAAELNALAADAQALQQQVSVGDVVTATVLPSNGLGDLLNILGSRVAASLPPTLVPGDVITATVTGFNGTQILLQVLSNGDGPVPPATVANLPAPPPSDASASVPPAPNGIASPSSAVVAASIRPNAPAPPPVAPGAPLDGPVLIRAIPGAPGTMLVQAALGGIEARLAAARAASVTLVTPAPTVPAPATPPPASAAAPLPAALLRARLAPPAPVSPDTSPTVPVRTFVVPPQIAPRPGDVPTANAGTTASSAAPGVQSVASYQDPAALVRALRLPVTPSNIAAAKLAIETPARLPVALATLANALPNGSDPRVATLRTLAAFVGRIDPASSQLAAQIEAYVDHVVTGSEPILADLLNAHVTAASPPAIGAAASTAPPVTAPPTSGNVSSAPAPAAEPALPVAALAQVAERAANLAGSLKEQLFSLVAGAPAGRGGEDVVPAAASALAAVTSVQLLAAQAATPQTFSFAIPMWLGSGYSQAQIAVDRDAPDALNVPLDGDNFHIAFVLNTKNLGVVAIDLHTVGRAFSLAVKTENLRTAQRFGDELTRLTDRLESLRYQAKSVEAIVAPGAGASASPLAPVVADTGGGEAAASFNERA